MTEIIERLEFRKIQLIENRDQLKESSRPVDLSTPIGRLSRMDAIQQQQMTLNALKQVEVSLEMLEAAFERLKKGEYGVCLQCDGEISEKRLLAKPEASLCLHCQKG